MEDQEQPTDPNRNVIPHSQDEPEPISTANVNDTAPNALANVNGVSSNHIKPVEIEPPVDKSIAEAYIDTVHTLNTELGENKISSDHQAKEEAPSAGATSGPTIMVNGATVSDPTKEAGYVNENLEIIGEDGKPILEWTPEDDIKATDTQTGVGISKKKKKKKPKSKRGLNAPTGFEEYYVDAPLTPAEHEEEKGIYDQSFPFAQRIEKAIQRYVAKRNLDSTRKTLFDRYLVHGGIEGGPKMFSGGLDAETLDSKNAAEIAEFSATNFVGADKTDIGKSDHVVDFEGCAKAFLSSQMPVQWELGSEEKTNSLIGVIRNFLNYLLYHDVCPEYKEQINNTRALCDQGVKELWSVWQAQHFLPGDFNKACSEIFGGMYRGLYTENRKWMDDEDIEFSMGISPEVARKTFKIALAANATEEVFESYKSQPHDRTNCVANREDVRIEITEIVFANKEVLTLYAQPQCAGLKPLGKMKAKTWHIPGETYEDLTEEEEAALAATPPETKEYEFWVEDQLLQKCFEGMKLHVTASHLSFGISYFDAVFGVYCSFHRVLPNALIMNWREPEKEWLPMRKKAGEALMDQMDEPVEYEDQQAGADEAEVDDNWDGGADESSAAKPEKTAKEDTTTTEFTREEGEQSSQFGETVGDQDKKTTDEVEEALEQVSAAEGTRALTEEAGDEATMNDKARTVFEEGSTVKVTKAMEEKVKVQRLDGKVDEIPVQSFNVELREPKDEKTD